MSSTQGSSSFASFGYTLVSSRPIYDQANGFTYEVVYDGLPSSISSLAASLQSDGARTTIENQGGTARLVAVYTRNPNESASSEVPFDRWSITVEEERKSLFSSPSVIAEAQLYTNPAEYKSLIEDAARGGEALTLSRDVYPLAYEVLELLTQGEETYPVFHPFLRRTREYSLTYTGTPWQVSLQGFVYTRAALIREFGIVAPLSSRIPLDPSITLPDGFAWGWYLAQQDFEYVRDRGGIKATETLGWRHGKWSARPSGSSISGVNVLIT